MILNKAKYLKKEQSIYIIAFFVLISVLFTAYLQGNNKPPKMPTLLTLEIRTAEDEVGQIFYDTGDGFNENERVDFRIRGSESFRTAHVFIPGHDIKAIRLDPMIREGKFDLRAIHFRNLTYQMSLTDSNLNRLIMSVYHHELEMETFVHYGHGSYISGKSVGYDPHFSLPGVEIENSLSWAVFITITLALIIIIALFLFAVSRLFYGQEKEIFFLLLLLFFAFPIQMPSIPLMILTTSALLLMALIIRDYEKKKNNANSSLLKLVELINNQKIIYSCLSLIITLAFILRFTNLIILDPYTDEYTHLMAARELLDSGTTGYSRAKLVTYLVALFYQLGGASSFYEYLYWGRIPGVIISSLTVIPIYYLVRKISIPIALISAFLWATSPWAIGVAKTIREYAYYPFFLLFAALALVKLYDMLISYDRKKLPFVVALSLTLAGFTYYAFFIDTASTLRIWAIIFAGVSVYYFINNISIIKELYKKSKPTFVTIIAVAGLVGWLMLNYRTGHASLDSLEPTGYSFNLFFNTSARGMPLHWWGNNNYSYIGLFIFGIGCIYAFYKKQRNAILPLAVFFVMLLFYTFFFDRYFRPRYLFYALPFFIPVIAVAYYSLADYLIKLKPRAIKLIAFVIVLLFLSQTINYQNIIYPVISDRHGYIYTTNEHHDYLGSTIELLERKMEPDDYFITTIFTGLLIYHLNIEPEVISTYDYRSETRFDRVNQVVSDNPQGFMILDWRRNGHFAEGYPHEGHFYIGYTRVEVIQNEDGMQVYRWKR